MRDLERMARDYPDSPLPDEQRGDILRVTQRFPDAVAAYDKAIGRVSHATASDWVLYLRPRRGRGAVAPVAEGEGRFRARPAAFA